MLVQNQDVLLVQKHASAYEQDIDCFQKEDSVLAQEQGAAFDIRQKEIVLFKTKTWSLLFKPRHVA